MALAWRRGRRIVSGMCDGWVTASSGVDFELLVRIVFTLFVAVFTAFKPICGCETDWFDWSVWWFLRWSGVGPEDSVGGAADCGSQRTNRTTTLALYLSMVMMCYDRLLDFNYFHHCHFGAEVNSAASIRSAASRRSPLPSSAAAELDQQVFRATAQRTAARALCVCVPPRLWTIAARFVPLCFQQCASFIVNKINRSSRRARAPGPIWISKHAHPSAHVRITYACMHVQSSRRRKARSQARWHLDVCMCVCERGTSFSGKWAGRWTSALCLGKWWSVVVELWCAMCSVLYANLVIYSDMRVIVCVIVWDCRDQTKVQMCNFQMMCGNMRHPVGSLMVWQRSVLLKLLYDDIHGPMPANIFCIMLLILKHFN